MLDADLSNWIHHYCLLYSRRRSQLLDLDHGFSIWRMLIRRGLRKCLFWNGVLQLRNKVVYSISLRGMDEHLVFSLLSASPNHSLSLQSERASLYFNLCRGGVYSFTRRDWSPRVGMLVCCYALRSSILEIHLFGEAPGGVRCWCFAKGTTLAWLCR